MIAAGEALYTLEQIVLRQHTIFNDSADVGLLHTPELQKTLHDACADLAQTYRGKTTRWGSGVLWSCFVPFEQDGPLYSGVQVKVALNNVNKKRFFTVDIIAAQQVGDPFKG